MKKLILLCVFLVSIQHVFCQEYLIHNITKQKTDSLLQLIDSEKDDNKRFSLVLSCYHEIIDTSPLLILEFSQKLYKISQKNQDIISEAFAWSYSGQGYRLSANYVKGLECQHKAIGLAEKIENKSVLAFVQNQIANIYKDREEIEKAFRMYLSAKENALNGYNKEVLSWPLMHIGTMYLNVNQADSSLFYLKQAYEIYKQNNISVYTPYLFTYIAGAYSKAGDEIQATNYFKMAIKLSEERNSERFINLACFGLAEHYQRFKQLDSCMFYAKKAISVVQNSVYNYLSMNPAKLLTDIYGEFNADSTLIYLKIYRAANDSLFSTRANQQLQMMTFEEEQRQQQLATEKIKYQNKIRMYLLLTGMFVFSFIAFVLFRNNRQKQKANRFLQQQKEEIQRTLYQLKSTQSQLIHSEKMASLGELTAGIAHEIQNPLNFVNNFSEISNELVEELKSEKAKGKSERDEALEDEILYDIRQNLDKITHHGKRAADIVKGMLQHSRTSSGVKEPTDINALADEYLRLSYHGLRAKDKSFNAEYKTDLDTSLPKSNIIPQDIGRVLLNLINNAFYAVNVVETQHAASLQHTPQKQSDYKPMVIVSTKYMGTHIEICVKDNGPGIPAEIKDKIFQPFFTTKPTGLGTGLGLSLSYDIVKAHGGELKVNTKEGHGSEFIIQLPDVTTKNSKTDD